MERSPASMPSTPGAANAGAPSGARPAGAAAGTDSPAATSGSTSPTASVPSTSSASAAATSKPSLSQQILRTLRPRSSAATAAPFVTSATVSPMLKASDDGSAPVTPFFMAASTAGKSSGLGASFVSAVDTQEEKQVGSLTMTDFQDILADLQKPVPLGSAGDEQRHTAIQHKLSGIQTLLAAIKLVTEAEEVSAEEQENVQWTSDQMTQPGPPQAEVFRVCLSLLTSAKEGKLPLPLSLAVCELVTASVHLSDLRAARATKAARETRSGAPGSQSAKAPDADHPLANIDRAAVYALVCHLSDNRESGSEQSEATTSDYVTRLPALPVQLKALECLSLEGRDVVSFPGILEFLGDSLQTVWKEMQVLRRLTVKEIVQTSTDQRTAPSTVSAEEQTTILEQLTLREWSVLSCLRLITSIIKFSFAKLDLASVEEVLFRVATMLLHPSTTLSVISGERAMMSERIGAKGATRRGARSKSKERRPLTDGYDYYGLDVLNQSSNTPSASATPRGAMTPKIGPRNVGHDGSTVAPIALATVPPVSAVTAATAAAAEARAKDDEQLIVQESEVRAALKLVDSVLRFGFMPPHSVDIVTKMLCRILGHNIVTPTPNVDWTALALPVLTNLIRSHCANASLRCARRMLVDVTVAEDEMLLCGAVELLKNALALVAEGEGVKNEDALSPTLSVPLLMPALSGALRRHMDVLDIQVLDLVSEMLPLKEGRHLLGQQLTPDDWDMLLELPAIAKRHLLEFNFDGDRSSKKATTPAVIEAMLNLIDKLRLADVHEAEEGKEGADELPWTPRLAALLMSLSPFLSDSLVIDLVQYFKARHLCLPCTSNWIDNVRALLKALFHRHPLRKESINNATSGHSGTAARHALVEFLFDHVYGTVQDLPKHRTALLSQVMIPLAQVALAAETDPVVEDTIRKTLIEAAVTVSSTTGAASEDEDGDESFANGEVIFRDIIDLHCKLARLLTTTVSTTHSNGYSQSGVMSPIQQQEVSSFPHVSFADPPGSHEHKVKSSSSVGGHSRQPSLTSGVPESEESTAWKRSKAVRSTLDLIAIFHKLAFSSPWVLLPTSRAVQQSERVQRRVWEKRARTACLTIFGTLLDLVRPFNETKEDQAADEAKETLTTVSTPVRLAILQWLVRLRTDSEHRLYITGDMNELILPAATTLGRGAPDTQGASTAMTASASSQQPNATMEDRSRARRDTVGQATGREGGRDAMRNRSAAERSASRIRDASRERGRRAENLGAINDNRDGSRMRSPSRAPITQRRGTIAEPLWRVPETLLFEVPPVGWRSDVVFTYMHPETDGAAPHHHRHHHHASSEEVPAPMPISAYIATCIAILANDREWDLVSYLLCHLPHQLANKHLVCGPKAQKEILVLRQLLATSILDQRLISQVILPDTVKRSDAYAVVYGTLTTLISYRALFSRPQQDELVEAFMAGLNKSSNTAQPCIRALTVACFELQKSINRHLPKMLVKMSTVMSSSTMSVHILEMIAAIGTLPSLYANFTETDYRRIFGIALQYIQYHNQRSAEEDARSSATAFTLSQYVIMLAYYNISLWFLILKIGDRAKYVESIRKGLLLANEGRAKVADQTEVCFDFLGRYTHSNAEPRPHKSFLNQIVHAKGAGGGVRNAGGTGGSGNEATSKHFLYGKGLLTVSSLDKAGWAEVLVRRPSGTLGLLCKLENIPVSQLPDEDGEREDLPAALMMNRQALSSTSRPQTSSQLAAWVRHQLHEREWENENRPLGPHRFGMMTRRPRSASDPPTNTLRPEFVRFKKTQADAYALGDISLTDDDGQLMEPESEELKATMSRVLAENASSIVLRSEERRGGPSSPNVGAPAATTEATRTRPSAGARNEHAIDPGFLALQLSSFPDVTPASKPPLLLPNEPWVQRMVRAVDLTPTVDFHRIGVLYVGAGQTKEREILGNRTGSTRYARFLRGMGDLITLRGQQNVYTGGLDTHNDDHGKYAYVWGDDICQIVYHTTTLMPNDEVHDPSHARKKALIGNDWVRIVWNEAGREYDFDTIKTQFNYINIIVSPNSRGGGELGSVSAADTLFYRVSLQCIEGLPNIAPIGDGQLVSAAVLPSFVRILALNCSLASQIFAATSNDRQSGQTFTYTSNWVSRLHHIERARTKMESEAAAKASGSGGAPNEKESTASTATANADGNADSATANVISASDTTAYDILRF